MTVKKEGVYNFGATKKQILLLPEKDRLEFIKTTLFQLNHLVLPTKNNQKLIDQYNQLFIKLGGQKTVEPIYQRMNAKQVQVLKKL